MKSLIEFSKAQESKPLAPSQPSEISKTEESVGVPPAEEAGSKRSSDSDETRSNKRRFTDNEFELISNPAAEMDFQSVPDTEYTACASVFDEAEGSTAPSLQQDMEAKDNPLPPSSSPGQKITEIFKLTKLQTARPVRVIVTPKDVGNGLIPSFKELEDFQTVVNSSGCEAAFKGLKVEHHATMLITMIFWMAHSTLVDIDPNDEAKGSWVALLPQLKTWFLHPRHIPEKMLEAYNFLSSRLSKTELRKVQNVQNNMLQYLLHYACTDLEEYRGWHASLTHPAVPSRFLPEAESCWELIGYGDDPSILCGS